MVNDDERERLTHYRLLDADGRLVRWPTKRPQRMLVLHYLRDRFAPDQVYSEAEVNELLKRWHTFEDWALLRRELVDRGYMIRDTAGHEYQVVGQSDSQNDDS
jgi:hypothetical protein